MNVTGPQWWQVNIGSGNGLVLPGKILIQLHVTIWHHGATMCKRIIHWNSPQNLLSLFLGMSPEKFCATMPLTAADVWASITWMSSSIIRSFNKVTEVYTSNMNLTGLFNNHFTSPWICCQPGHYPYQSGSLRFLSNFCQIFPSCGGCSSPW